MSIAFLNYEPVLRGSEGDLVLIRIATEARHLEEVLEAVADLPFPVNPEIQHPLQAWVLRVLQCHGGMPEVMVFT